MTEIGVDSLGEDLQKSTEEEIKEVYRLLGLKYDSPCTQEEDSWKAVFFYCKKNNIVIEFSKIDTKENNYESFI